MTTDRLLELMRLQLRNQLAELQARYEPELEVECTVITDLDKDIRQHQDMLVNMSGAG